MFIIVDVSSLQGRLGFEPSQRKGLVYLLRFCVVYSNNKLVMNVVNSIIVWWDGRGGSSVLSTSMEQCHIQTFFMAYCGILGDKGVRIRKEATVLCASCVAFIGATGARLPGWGGRQPGSTIARDDSC